MNVENAKTTRAVAKHLGIGESTLRAWCRSLQSGGYVFSTKTIRYRTGRELVQRIFEEQDIEALEHYRASLVSSRKMAEATKLTVEHFSESLRQAEEHSETPEPKVSNGVIDEDEGYREWRQFLNGLKEEVCEETGIRLGRNQTSKLNGTVGGLMMKKIIGIAKRNVR